MNMGGPYCVELLFEKHRVSSKEVDISEQELEAWWGQFEEQTL